MPQRKTKLVYLAPAREDLLNIARYHLEKVGAASAKKITDAIVDYVENLSAYPLLGRSHPDPVLADKGYRSLVVSHPYVCIYKVFPDGVYIYRIVNGTTDYPKLLK